MAAPRRTSSASAQKLKEQLDQARVELEQAQREGDFDARRRARPTASSPSSSASLKEAEAAESHRMIEEAVTDQHIAGVVSRWTGIPVDKMLAGRARQAARDGRQSAQPRRRPGRGGGRRRRTPIRRARAGLAGPEPADRLVPVPRARPASARPSWPRRWPSSCSTTRARCCASTCRNTWRSTRSRG